MTYDPQPLPPCGSGLRRSADKMPATTKAGKPRKRNQYAAVCTVCGARLAPGEGVIERASSAGGWVAFCAER